MSVEALNKVMYDSLTRETQRLTLLILANRLDPLGYGWPSAQYIADRTLLSLPTTRRHLKAIEAAGELAIIERPGSSNAYQLMIGLTEEEVVTSLTQSKVGLSLQEARDLYRLAQDRQASALVGEGDHSYDHPQEGDHSYDHPPTQSSDQSNGRSSDHLMSREGDPPDDQRSKDIPKEKRDIDLTPLSFDLEAVLAVWPQVLEEARLQMTKATFSAWLQGATVKTVDTPWDPGDPPVVVIEVKSKQAAQWINGRLKETLGRTLTMLLETPAQAYASPAAVDPDFVRVTQDPNSAKVPANA